MKKIIWKIAWQSVTALLFLLLVWWIAYLSAGNELLVPSFATTLEKMGELFVQSSFWQGMARSILRSVCAFGISFLIALIFAVIAYMVPSLQHFFTPIVSAFRTLPVLAVLLILLSFLGAGEAPVAVACLSLFPMLYTSILAALSGIDENLLAASRIQGATVWTRIFRLYLPLSAPYVLREAGGALSFSLKLVVSAEVLANTAQSLGGMMQEAKIYGEIPTLFALVVATFLIGLCIEIIFSIIVVYGKGSVI